MTPDEKAYDQIMKIAEQHGLIVQAYGGVATIATHADQRKAGIFEKCRDMSGNAGKDNHTADLFGEG